MAQIFTGHGSVGYYLNKLNITGDNKSLTCVRNEIKNVQHKIWIREEHNHLRQLYKIDCPPQLNEIIRIISCLHF